MFNGGNMKNRRIMSLFVFFLAVLLLMPSLAKAQSFKVRVVTQDASVRLKPEANSPVISAMPLGSVLEAEEGTAEWYKVTLPPDENGFVVIGYIQKSDTEMVSAAPVKQKQVAPAAPVAQPVVTSPQPQMPQVAPRPKGFGGMEFGLRAFGGGAMLFGTDHLDNYWADYIPFEEDYWTWWSGGFDDVDISGDVSPLNFGLSGGMEVFFNLNPYIGFGLGGGFISSSKEGFVEYMDTFWGDDWDETFIQKFTAPYFQLTVYGGLPIGNMFRVMPYVGMGVYMGKLSIDYMYTYRDVGYDYDESWYWVAKSNAFGFHGGLNFEIYFTRNIGFFLGGGVIMATFKELIGDLDWNYSDSDGWSDSDTDTDQQLWFYEEEGWLTSNYYANIAFNENEPSTESWRRNVEPGFFSLTQFRFVMGIVIYLMR